MSNPYVNYELAKIQKQLQELRPHMTNKGMCKIGGLIVELTDLQNFAAPQDQYPTDENNCHRGFHHNR